MLQRFLFIGVGGSGGKTLNVLRDQLERKLDAVDWDRGFPRGWQFLHIDVPTVSDTADPTLPPPIPRDDYCGLVAGDLKYPILDGALISGTRQDRVLLESIVGWRPNPSEAQEVPISKGAGQFRALGRVVAATQVGTIRKAIKRATDRLDDSSLPELRELTERFKLLPGEKDDPRVFVITSIAGGAGAGIVMDVCDVLRGDSDAWLDASVGILFAPDVFKDLRPAAKVGVQPNALATLAELLAGYWDSDPIDRPPGETAWLARAGIPGEISRRGIRYPFVIGSSNGRITFGNQNEMYRAMGRTLAAFVVSPTVQTSFGAYLTGNWRSSSDLAPDSTGLLPTASPNALSSLGFARVATGRDRFQDYASERLARMAVERLLRGHLEKDPRMPPREALEQATNEAWHEDNYGFLRASGLQERTENIVGGKKIEHDDVLLALRPGSQLREGHPLIGKPPYLEDGRLGTEAATPGASLDVYADELTAEVGRGVRQQKEPQFWLDRIRDQYRGRRDAIAIAQAQARGRRASAWVVVIREHLRDLAIKVTATHGLRVAERLFVMLEKEMGQVVSEFENEQLRFQEESRSVLHQAQLKVKAFGGSMLPNNPLIGQMIEATRDALTASSEAELRQTAIELINDLRAGLLGPLATELTGAYEDQLDLEASSTMRDEKTKQLLVESWPNGDFIPERFGPAVNEFFIEPYDEFEETFKLQLQETMGTKSAGAALESTLQEILATALSKSGAQGTRVAVPRLIEFTTDWSPQRKEYRGESEAAPARAELESHVGLADLVGRARAWLGRPGEDNLIGRFIHQSLREYLDDARVEASVQRDRLGRFRTAFEQTIDTAAPFAEINSAVLQRVHGRQVPDFARYYSEIPFPKKTPGHDVVTDVLKQRGYQDEDLEEVHFGEGSESEIEIFSLLDYPHHPVVFDSLIEPIAGDWASRDKDPDGQGRVKFWRWRRSRPLPEFVPVAPAVRRAMVRGWFTAKVLNQLRDRSETEPVSIYVPVLRGFADFPYPYLGEDPFGRQAEILPAVFESMPLAMLILNTNSNSTVYDAYRRLRELGQVRPHEDHEYPTVNLELKDWILNGQTQPGAPETVERFAGPSGDAGWQQRREAVEGVFNALIENYERDFQAVNVTARADKWERPPRAWELRDDILRALTELAAAARDLKPDGTDVEFSHLR